MFFFIENIFFYKYFFLIIFFFLFCVLLESAVFVNGAQRKEREQKRLVGFLALHCKIHTGKRKYETLRTFYSKYLQGVECREEACPRLPRRPGGLRNYNKGEPQHIIMARFQFL